jgi:hypothetical protein
MSMVFLTLSPLILISIGSFGLGPPFPALKAFVVQVPLLVPQLSNFIATLSLSIFGEGRRPIRQFFLISILFEVCHPLFQ